MPHLPRITLTICPSAHATRTILALLLIFSLAACTTTTPTQSNDPWEDWNRSVQDFNDTVDDYAMKPVAQGYRWITPAVVDTGITNFFNNLDDVGVFVNDFLQFKLAEGGQDIGRFMINSVAGVGGFMDVASEVDLPKHREDFDQTLAVWGVPSGPYLVLPIFGSSTPRHVLGLAGDTVTNPVNFIAPLAVPLLSGALNAIDKRADMLSASKIAEQAATDRYEFLRNAYLQERDYQIHDGNPPVDEDLEKEIDSQLGEQPARNESAATP